MIVYRLRDKDTMQFYSGNGMFDKKGKFYTNKGHIKNSLTQSWNSRFPKPPNIEVVVYELKELKTEEL